MKTTSIIFSVLLELGLASADTLSVDLHAASGCFDTAFQTFTIGNINECHNADDTFYSFTQHNIAQSFFGRNLGIRAFRDPNCQGPYATDFLSNARQCVTEDGRSLELTYID